MSKEGVIKSLEYRKPQVNLEGLTEKRNRRGTVYYENENREILWKVCRQCGIVKALDDYVKHKGRVGDCSTECRDCAAGRKKKYYEKNRETVIERSCNWQRSNPEMAVTHSLKWARKNRDKRTLSNQRRRARRACLPALLSNEEYAKTLEHFGNACALTGKTDGLEKEHAIPISIGHGGTTFENCYPMTAGLNQSKFNHNIFEWFEANRQRFELSQERFDNLIAWLASANAMTIEEYRDHVYWCHANPRTIDELEAQ